MICVLDLVLFIVFTIFAFVDTVIPENKKYVNITREYTTGNGTRVVEAFTRANVMLLAAVYFVLDVVLANLVVVYRKIFSCCQQKVSQGVSSEVEGKAQENQNTTSFGALDITLRFFLAYLFTLLALCVLTGQTDIYKLVLFSTVAVASHTIFALAHDVATTKWYAFFMGLLFAVVPWSLFATAIASSSGIDTKYLWACMGLFAVYYVGISVFQMYIHYARTGIGSHALSISAMQLFTLGYQTTFSFLVFTILRS